MTVLDLYWSSDKKWWHFEGLTAVVNDDAPEEAKKSYENYKKQLIEKKDVI